MRTTIRTCRTAHHPHRQSSAGDGSGSRTPTSLWPLLLCSALAGACGGASGADGGAGDAAIDAPTDTGFDAADAPDVASRETGTDARIDAGTDTGVDAATDSGTDAATDSSADSSTDAGTDSNTDAGTDTAPVDAGCPGDAASCGTDCADLSTDVHHCGACYNDCTALPGVMPGGVACASGACVLACAPGRGDCSGGAADGCETDLTSPDHCGDCATACLGPTPTCNASGSGYVCAPPCAPSLTLCGAACVDTTSDPSHCGDCTNACPVPTNGTATCTANACGFFCNPGYQPQGGACVTLPAPRPIAPLSTSTVTSQRPTLRWALATNTDGARVEVCRDRACTMPVTTFDVTGTSATPSVDLPRGVVFWRLRSRSAGTTWAGLSATWEFTVGPRTAPVDNSWGSVPDVNGDGYADAVVGAIGTSNGGKVFVYHGSAAGLAMTAATTLASPDIAQFGASVASAGDVNGDGYADVIVGAPAANTYQGRAQVFLGSPIGLATTPAITLTGAVLRDQFGASVSGAGDVNGDGYADVIVGAPAASSGAGTAYVYLGSADGLAATAAWTATGGTNAALGTLVASAGDVNGDGYGDVMFSAGGYVQTYYGRATGLSSGALLSGNAVLGYGAALSCAGDVNGDGYADVTVGEPNYSRSRGRLYVYEGGYRGVGTTAVTTIDGQFDYEGLGGSLSAGDFNGDGYSDVMAGVPSWNNGFGEVNVYVGSSTGTAMYGGGPSGPGTGQNYFGGPAVGLGDANGDGIDDALISAQRYSNYTGLVYQFNGSSSGLGLNPTATLTGPTPDARFGNSLAHAL